VLDLGVNNRAEGQTPDARVARLAQRQHGIVTARQLRTLGISTAALKYRIRVGRLHPIHRGVYAVGHRNLSEKALFIAAVAAIGADAALSHVSAAALWSMTRSGRDVDVTTTRSVKARKGIRLHVVRALPPTDVTRRHGIPVTTPARTILDVADVFDDRKLARTVHEGEVQRMVTNAALRAQLRRSPGRRGATKLAAIVDEGPIRTRSELEEATYYLLRRVLPTRGQHIVARTPGLARS
jgi:predicted transcriptional regulator of viral defense system